MNLALSFSGFTADVPIPCLVLNLLFMKEVSKGPKCSHVLHICLHRGTMTFGDRTEFRKKFSSMTVLWIRTSKSSHGPGSQLPTLNIRMIWGEWTQPTSMPILTVPKVQCTKRKKRKSSRNHLPWSLLLWLVLLLLHILQKLFSDISHENSTQCHSI